MTPRHRGESISELQRLGEEGLRTHVLERADLARRKYGNLGGGRLPEFLTDPECVRRPTRLEFDAGTLEAHQFGEVRPDPLDSDGGCGVVLCLRPEIREHPDWLPVAVSYLVPVINYGEIATDEECLRYGAAVLGMEVEAFYDLVCRVADAAGAQVRWAGT